MGLMHKTKQRLEQAKNNAFQKFFLDTKRMETLAAKILPDYKHPVLDNRELLGNWILFDLATGKISKNEIKEKALELRLLFSESYLWGKKRFREKGEGQIGPGDTGLSMFELGNDKMIWKWLEHVNKKHKAPAMEVQIFGYKDGDKNCVYVAWYNLKNKDKSDFHKGHMPKYLEPVGDGGGMSLKEIESRYTRTDPNCGIIVAGSSKKAEEDAHRLASYMKTIGFVSVEAYGYGQNPREPKPGLVESLKGHLENTEKVAFSLMNEIIEVKDKKLRLEIVLKDLKDEIEKDES